MGPAVGGRRDLPLRPLPRPRRGVRHRLAAADGQRLAARRACPVLHAHRPGGPLPADAGAQRVLPGGLGRQRAADRAPGAAGLRGALRAHPAVRPGLQPTVHSGPEAAGAGEPARLRRAVPASRARPTRRRSRRCGAGSGFRWTGRWHTPPSTSGPGAPRSWPSSATWPAAMPTGPTDRRSGTSTSAPRWRRRSSPTARWTAPGAPSRSAGHCGHHAAGAAAGLRRRGGAPVGRALRRPDRRDGADTGLRRRGAGVTRTRWPTRTRAPGWRWCAPSAT